MCKAANTEASIHRCFSTERSHATHSFTLIYLDCTYVLIKENEYKRNIQIQVLCEPDGSEGSVHRPLHKDALVFHHLWFVCKIRQLTVYAMPSGAWVFHQLWFICKKIANRLCHAMPSGALGLSSNDAAHPPRTCACKCVASLRFSVDTRIIWLSPFRKEAYPLDFLYRTYKTSLTWPSFLEGGWLGGQQMDRNSSSDSR